MENVFMIFKHNIKMYFSKKIYIFLFLIPILSTAIIVNIFNSIGDKNYTLAVVDEDKSYLSEDIIGSLQGQSKYDLKEFSREEAKEKIAKGKIQGALVIEENFKDDLIKGKNPKVSILSLEENEKKYYLREGLNSFIGSISSLKDLAKGDEEKFKTLYKDYINNKLDLKVSKDLQDYEKNSGIYRTVLGMFIMFIMYTASNGISIILREKIDKTYERICSSPVSSKAYILGNMMGCYLILELQILLQILLLNILKISLPISFINLFIVLSILGLVGVAIAMVILVFSPSMDALGIMSTVIITPLSMLGGCFWPKEFMSKTMQNISILSPVTWGMDALTGLIEGKKLIDITSNIVIMLGFSIVLFLIAQLKMNKEEKAVYFK
ncbi:ABC transporter permease [Clostridium hydrogeniformans]|uniref:ABC transporter permease n=1 Tax=Clostridium hydrogeniformans TaxID=349933 RepID=UPI000484640E|nr:ABC transporter permease [Clostridium hydrogeniformans]